MKKITLLLALICSTIALSQNYQYLGTFSSDGTPDYLEPVNDVITGTLLETVNNALPESYPVPDFNPQYLSSGYDTDIVLEADGDIWVTFVGEGAGYKNVLGFYTYDATVAVHPAPTPSDVTIIFPNISAQFSGGGLIPGNKVHLGSFTAGTGIGWVLLANGYQNNQVTPGLWQLYSNEDYNPENDPTIRQHNVLLNDSENERIILGFEDIRRDYASCDQDFNDAIFYITANPFSALKTTNLSVPDSGLKTVSSGNDGGLESNGDLAGLIAKRNLTRLKENNKMSQKSMQRSFLMKNGTIPTSLDGYLPNSGKFNTEVAQYSTPTDLIGITNANEVLAVDYYLQADRVSAVLATSTQNGVYDHSKAICDRLNKSVLDDVRTVTARGHQLLISTIIRDNGEVEYAVSFSIKLGTAANEVFSFWSIDRYPAGDYNNYQVWGGSYSQVFHIVNHILDAYTVQKTLNSVALSNVVPPVFVRSGYYEEGKLYLEINNSQGYQSLFLNTNLKATEVASLVPSNSTLSLTGSTIESIVVDTGSIFDAGVSITPNQNEQIDALYLADGPWGTDYVDGEVLINTFDVTTTNSFMENDVYYVERNPSIQGQIKETLNLFRHLKAGDQLVTVSDYDQMSFTVNNSLPMEIILITDEDVLWADRYRYNIPAHLTAADLVINFSDFLNSSGASTTSDQLRSVVFSVSGDYSTFQPFNLSINDLKFKSSSNTLSLDNNSLLEQATVSNYPNPFVNNTTFELVNESDKVSITLFDLSGRVVDVQKIQTGQNNRTVSYSKPSLKPGIYMYRITDEKNQSYSGRVVKE
ncbi:DUF4114 domain-containing protein [Nonlabens sp. Asnod2-A12]|uniref:DUF4114 domain-containing protein n=1 Tax=Nonlabens sp. Asnod2-A12 TaxID=3160578 RepID=UPI0038641778